MHDHKKNINRINRIIGHANKVKHMLENDEPCEDILIQISAVRSALNGLGKTVLKEHLEHCIVQAVKDGDENAMDHLNSAIDKLVK